MMTASSNQGNAHFREEWRMSRVERCADGPRRLRLCFCGVWPEVRRAGQT
jgi:hypothetical protein